MSEYLVMEDITKDFSGGRALDHVCFSVEKANIHGLLGGNGAGKTTLMNILSGNYPYGTYSGDFYISGKLCKFNSPKDSTNYKIAIVHQELSLIQQMSIADNIFLADEIGNRFFVDKAKTRKEAKRVLDLVGLEEDPDTLIEEIGAGKQQLVEIAKALSKDPDLLILDEPTSSLGQEHFEKLAEIMFNLKANGKTIIIISHKLNEMLRVCDKITILRDGKTIDTLDNSKGNIDENKIIRAMAGHSIDDLYPKRNNIISDELALRLTHYNVMSQRRKGQLSLEDINMEIHKGEVVGLYGLMASGRSKLVKSIFGRSNGLDTSGDIEIYGKKVELKSPKEAIEAGIGYVAEDRINLGLSKQRSIRENMTLAGISKISDKRILNKVKEKKVAKDNMESFHIKADSYEQEIHELSGGNQQKVLLSEWFYTDPKVLILDEPTKGIDVEAKHEIYNIINNYAIDGGAVLLISSDLSEIFGLCDKIYILSEGRITGMLNKDEFSSDRVMSLILKDELS